MQIQIPKLSLVLLVGAAGSGKSTFAKRHFQSTRVVSSDFYRGVVSNDESDQSATSDAFAILHQIVAYRLKRGLLTVIDATNLEARSRDQLRLIGKKFNVRSVAIVFNLPLDLCLERNRGRERKVPEDVLANQARQVPGNAKKLEKEGFFKAFILNAEQMDQAEIELLKMPPDLRSEKGPFDLIGDIHGCFNELKILLEKLGYQIDKKNNRYDIHHPQGRKPVFLGDLVDRGPNTPEVLRLVMDLVDQDRALCVPGNHEVKLYRKLMGKEVNMAHGLAESVEQMARETPEFANRVCRFIEKRTHHLVLDDGRLVAAHAGIKHYMIMRDTPRVRSFALWGDVSGKTDEYGLPIRGNWAQKYKGEAMVVYGHTPVARAVWENNTICIDTGCVFGGKLTALRYPEAELVSTPALKTWYQPVRPIESAISEESQ